MNCKDMKKIQVTHLFEDTGFCKDVFQSVSQPYYYCNRDSVDGTWYTSTPEYFENDCRIRSDVVIEILLDGQVAALDGNGIFDGKRPFVPFSRFSEDLAQRFGKQHPHLRGYEEMKRKLLSLPGGEAYADPHSCYENWLYALNFGHEKEQTVETASWMTQEYIILAVQYVHVPTSFPFVNFRFRASTLAPGTASHDLLLYDWEDNACR